MFSTVTLIKEKSYDPNTQELTMIMEHPTTKIRYQYVFQGVHPTLGGRLMHTKMIGKHYFEQLKIKFAFQIARV